MRTRSAALVLALAVVRPSFLPAQVPCPQAAGADAEAGWQAYRSGELADAFARFAAALARCPGDPYASTGMGYVALRRGDRAGAAAAFATVLAARPDDVDALVGTGILAWWGGDRRGAGVRFARVLELDPGNATAAEFRDRIQAAERVPPPVNETALTTPSGVEERIGLGGSLIVAGDTRGAVAAFRQAVAADPGNQAARVGLGRALTWGGRLREGEEVLRAAGAAHPSDVSAQVALAQNLRWQGRNVAALEVLEEAERRHPLDGDVREQRSWVDAALSPQVRPGAVGEWDSEENRMVTTTLVATVRPIRRLSLRADGYRRSLELGVLRRGSQGLSVSAQWEAEPGWSLSGGVGGSRDDGSGSRTRAAWTVSLSSPRRQAVSGSFTAASAAFDVTAPLVERGVRLTEAVALGRWTPAPLWSVEATAGVASFDGSEGNVRRSAAASLSRRVGRVWTLGTGVRAFGFSKDLNDGYFDPGFLGIAEVSARWMHEPGRWSLLAEVAPAVQQVTRKGDPAGAVRAAARVSFRLAPGREVVLSGGVSSTGLQSFSTGAADYRYRALGLGAVWTF